MAKEDKVKTMIPDQKLNVEEIKRHLEMLDERLDNIDSIVTAVAERVMNQPIALNLTCPHCSKNVEITIMGRGRPTV